MATFIDGPFTETPAGWLYRAARNQALDIIRRENVFREKAGDIALELDQWSRSFDQTPNDDQLQMIFACCHPSLPPDARVALTLKTVGGFGVSELARAFLTSETTIAQRLVRAKISKRESPRAIRLRPAMPKRTGTKSSSFTTSSCK